MGNYELKTSGNELSTAFENLPREKWNKLIDELFIDFPNGSQDGVLTTYFLRSTYPKIGGQILRHIDRDSHFWGLLLPRRDPDGNNWTLRTYLSGSDTHFQEKHQTAIQTFLYSSGVNPVFWYDTRSKRDEKFVGKVLARFGDFGISFPDIDQAKEAENLQKRIWNVTDPAYLYPFDLYHPDAGMATRLVAIQRDEVIGFLFGFYGRGNQWTGTREEDCIWIESQLMGVEPKHRREGVAKRLKLTQRQLALEDGIKLIRWTVDPLQAGNAFLNLNELGGIAMHFYPDYYPFRNDLNRVRASRIAISWFLESERVQERITGGKKILNFKDFKLDSSTEIVIPVDDSGSSIRQFDYSNWKPQGSNLLVHIPSNWNELQRTNVNVAVIWREATDALWGKILGTKDDNYGLVGMVENSENNDVFVVAQRFPAKIVR
ncbi:hypothetical protein A2210_00640 [Candidatus Woesebacteria bacterium RIFOXYA1_FULL_40_18]|uniref:N-acetyltransferase domain-containing protein n=1 Tax=Candidatus Woesebacteria bacterium RIFOXYA1_FULL_40_18 TaxID=1802532 RepID=A0A1F8CM32_9BACT|nr:MAG: hypothetical protein A2210_00640 [Candidatus Woesebacteria bacterium RIFOXYA1_FULL_40_18]